MRDRIGGHERDLAPQAGCSGLEGWPSMARKAASIRGFARLFA